MSNLDKNKIFFGLLHYIFTEQPNVNWAFKTSLINFTGLNESMNQRKYKNDSISESIIKYVKEVKPYHVQFNHYIEKFTAQTDICNLKISDSIFPTIKVRYDNVAPLPDIKEYLYSRSSEPYEIQNIHFKDEYKYGKFEDFKISVSSYYNTEEEKYEWLYTGVIYFDKNYKLPLIIHHNYGEEADSKSSSNKITYNIKQIEKTSTKYTGAIFKNNKWILANPKDTGNYFEWERADNTLFTIAKSTASSIDNPKWDYNNNFSTNTDTYYGKISENGLTLTIYNNDNSIFREYDLTTFSEQTQKEHTETIVTDTNKKVPMEVGTKYFNDTDKHIYKLINTKDNIYSWVYDSIPIENELYYFKNIDKIKIYKTLFNKNLGEYVTDFYDLELSDYFRLNETTAANRVFLYKTHDLNLLNEYINAHFKGITIESGNFNIDRYGYDAFLYDLKRYEEPTKTEAYCLIDVNYNYIPVGTDTFTINEEDIEESTDIVIKSIIDGIETTITDYSKKHLNNEYVITLFRQVQPNEVIEIRKNSDNTLIGKPYKANTFTPSDDDGYKRIFKDITDIGVDPNNNVCYIFDMPNSSIKYDKVAISIEKPTGYRYPIYEFQDYTIKDNKIYITHFNIITDNGVISKSSKKEYFNWKVYISVADMSLLYDKVYTWEDVYGVSNNKATWEQYYKNHGLIQNINGNDFLNPLYEKNRPDELCVTYPQESLTIYKIHDNEDTSKNSRSLFNYDFKNIQTEFKSVKLSYLTKDLNIGDTEIYVDKDIFKKPYKDKKSGKLLPGKLLIGSELIEFYDYELHEDKSIILKNIRRGTNGTCILKKISIEDDNGNKIKIPVYAYSNPKNIPLDLVNSYYFVKDINLPRFTINGYYPNKNKINVFKNNNIKLLSDITQHSTSFIINDNSITLPLNNKKGYLYINDVKISFKTIVENNDSTYTISNFDNPFGKEFYVNDNPYIPSNKFVEVSEDNYSIITEDYYGYEDNKAKQNNYIVFNESPNIGECIIIENHFKNAF